MFINFFGNLLFKNKSLFRFLLNYKSSNIRVVYYHMINESDEKYYFKNKCITPLTFKNHLIFLKKNFNIISFKEMIYLIENKKPLNNKLLITTDDGFYENYKYILPITDELKLNFTSFLITSCLNNKNLMWRNKLIYIFNSKSNKEIQKSVINIIKKYGLNDLKNLNFLEWSWKNISMDKKDIIVDDLWNDLIGESVSSYLDRKEPYLNENQVRDILDNGNYIGSHSHSHPDFSRLNKNQIKEEMFISNNIIKSKFNVDKIPFSFPFGKRGDVNDFSDLIFLNRNYLNNSKQNKYFGRDNLEFNFNEMIVRLTFLPIIRSLLKY